MQEEEKYDGPKIIASIGKGGCGKTTVACAIAYNLASMGKKTFLLDCNKQGVGITRGLSPEGRIEIPRNPRHGETFSLGIENLVGGATFRFDFKPLSLSESKEKLIKKNPERDREFSEYMGQFLGQYGFLAFNTMFADFFGVFASTQQAADFITLSKYYHQALEQRAQFIVLDMKASDDFADMYLSSVKAAHSLENMNGFGFLNLELIQRALKMPDIRRFLETKYVKQDAKKYSAEMRESALALTKTGFCLVCGNEAEKVDEMLGELQPLVDRLEDQRREVIAYIRTEMRIRDWKKKGRQGKRPSRVYPEEVKERKNTQGYIINNVYPHLVDPDEYESQQRQIERVRVAANDRVTSFNSVYHDKRLGGWDFCPDKDRKKALNTLGYELFGKYFPK